MTDNSGISRYSPLYHSIILYFPAFVNPDPQIAVVPRRIRVKQTAGAHGNSPLSLSCKTRVYPLSLQGRAPSANPKKEACRQKNAKRRKTPGNQAVSRVFAPFYAMNASIASGSLMISFDRTSHPSSVIRRSSSMRMPIASSSMYNPGSSLMTQPG